MVAGGCGGGRIAVRGKQDARGADDRMSGEPELLDEVEHADGPLVTVPGDERRLEMPQLRGHPGHLRGGEAGRFREHRQAVAAVRAAAEDVHMIGNAYRKHYSSARFTSTDDHLVPV